MARGKKKEKELTPEEKLQQALVSVEEQPYKIPENWCWLHGHAFLNQMETKRPSGSAFSYVDIDSIDNSRQVVTAPKLINVDEAPSRASRALHTGDTVFSMVRPYLKNIAFIDETLAESIGTTGFYVCSPKKNVNPKYNYYMMISPYVVDGLNAYMKGDNSPSIRKTDIEMFPYPIPPLPEQQRIVDRIESLFAKLDEAKEKAQAVVDGFEDRKAAILHKAFTGELTSIKNADSINYVLSEIHKWSVTFPAKDIKAIEKEQEKASIICLPDGRNWIKCTVGAIGRVTNGSTPSRKCSDYWNGNIPWVSSGEVRNNTIYITNECITQKGFDNSSVKLLPKGTILIAMIGEGKTRGQSAILEIEATINQNIAAIVIDHGLVEPEFLWFWFQMNYKKNREKGSGSGPQALNCQRVRELDCICPSIKEQREIVTLLKALILKEEQVNENAEHVMELIDNIKKSILARAFRGELGTNDPTDESAEKLLKRILI